jgi:hypothetical protein
LAPDPALEMAPFYRAANIREYPVSVTLANGEIVEGVIDFAWSDGASWTVVDYKAGRADMQYETQVQLYACPSASHGSARTRHPAQSLISHVIIPGSRRT